jgi:WD40 repeat protein/serine/threonine protein kinase
LAEIPTGDWSLVDEAAQRFERAWQKGPRPRIEDFLSEVPEAVRPLLLGELLRVERELRVRAGEAPSADEYRRRFPERDDVVTSVFASVHPARGTPSVSPPGGLTTMGTRGDGSKLPPELADHPDYEIIRELGHGGMGVVFLAHNRIVGRHEVLKVIGPDVIESPGVFDRFRNEIRAVARLQHPNIVTAHTAFRCGKSLVFSMEYVDGLDLARLVRANGPVPVAHACYFARQTALGLQHAHEAGMVHRDIKPNNLMLTHKRGKAVIKVLDFGLAKAEREQNLLDTLPSEAERDLSGTGDLTAPGEMLGTPDFIAPEQIANSQTADIRADIYSLGCTLYYLLTGRPPFSSSSTRETLRAHTSMDAPLLNLVRPEVPAELAALVAKMMAKEPSRRFQTPSEVADALAPFYKKATASALSPNAGVDQDFARGAGGTAPSPLADTGHGMWSSLIDLREQEDDEGPVPAPPNPGEKRLQWLWPAVAAGVLCCGLVGAWAAGLFTSVPVKRDSRDMARAGVGNGRGDGKRAGVPISPPVAPELENGSPLVAGLSPGPEASAATQHNNNIRAEFGDGAIETLPPAEPPVESKAPTTVTGTTSPAQNFHEITSIKTSQVALQARLVSGSGHVLYETGGRNRALWRVDVQAPENPRKLEAGVPAWTYLALANDGRIAVLAGTDNSLWYWDLQSGEARRLIRRDRANITELAIASDHQVVAYVRDGAIYFWDMTQNAASNKKELSRGIGVATELIAFSPDGRRIVSTHGDRAIRIWDVNTRRQIGRPSETPQPVSALAMFPEGLRLLISVAGPTVVWDLATNRGVLQAPDIPRSIALSTDCRRALIGGGNDMRLWDLETGDQLIREVHTRPVRHVSFSSDDRQAISVTDESIRVWSLPLGRAAVDKPPVVEIAEFLPRVGYEIHRTVVVSPLDGRLILTGGWPNSVRFWNRETSQFIHKFNENGGITQSIAFSPKGRTLALTGGEDSVVRLWDIESREHRDLRGHKDVVMSVAFSPDGRLAYSAGGLRRGTNEDGTDFAVRVWDVESGQQLRPFDGHSGTVWSLAVSTDGRYLLSGGNDAVAILWDAKTGRIIHRLSGHGSRVHCVAFLPGARRVVSAGDDSMIRFWDVDNGREILGHFKDPTGGNGWLAVSPNGTRLFSARGNELLYWNLDTGKVIQTLKWEEPPVGGSFTPDGRHVVWGGLGGNLRIYRLLDVPEPPNAAPRRSPNAKKRAASTDDAVPHDARGIALSPAASRASD